MPDNRKRIIWGAGNIGEELVKKYRDSGIAYVLDNDIRKRGRDFFGYKVVCPDDIRDWTEYEVIVAAIFTKYNAIKRQLLQKGLVEYRDFWSYKNVVNLSSLEELQMQIDSFVQGLRERDDGSTDKVLLLGKLNGRHKENVSRYLDRLAGQDKGHQWMFLSESSFGEIEDWFSYMEVLAVPDLFLQNQYKGNAPMPYGEDMGMDDDIREAACAMQFGVEGMPAEYALLICKKAEKFYRQILEILQPDRVYIWNAFTPLHKVFAKVCREEKIEAVYVENGVLPGTLAFDKNGQMGESFPALCHQEFLQIPVSIEEKNHAEEVIHFLKDSGLNRYQQKEDADFIQSVKDKLMPGRPVILFAGGLDHMSGLVPHNGRARKYHSPVFGTSEEAAQYLKGLAKKNRWNLIYKAHPWLPSDMESDESGFLCINKGNINDLIDLCDVVVTIVSQVSYLALIRNKPAVMLGYIQLRQQGCTYEAFEREKIPDILSEAVRNGLREEMREAFANHVARLEKAYLFDDMTEKEIQIGRDISMQAKEEVCGWERK
ncbi:MAG: hypothetical protein HFH72_04380 [Lachnospiraceae bacterium]|nr:hypothetical protein [Lachnospiraceae bacterium]